MVGWGSVDRLPDGHAKGLLLVWKVTGFGSFWGSGESYKAPSVADMLVLKGGTAKDGTCVFKWLVFLAGEEGSPHANCGCPAARWLPEFSVGRGASVS